VHIKPGQFRRPGPRSRIYCRRDVGLDRLPAVLRSRYAIGSKSVEYETFENSVLQIGVCSPFIRDRLTIYLEPLKAPIKTTLRLPDMQNSGRFSYCIYDIGWPARCPTPPFLEIDGISQAAIAVERYEAVSGSHKCRRQPVRFRGEQRRSNRTMASV
jgi:hypothetical protein